MNASIGRYAHKGILLWVVVLVVVQWLVLSLQWRRGQAQQAQYLQREASSLQRQYQSVLNTFATTAEIVFEQSINRPEVLQLYAQVHGADNARRGLLRDSLLRLMQPSYQLLRRAGYRQLHFHLPNNESFLRLHRPERYGDNLSHVRKTVALANAERRRVVAFEEGRIFNGFRFVFPLAHQGRHLGTVETSLAFEAIRAQMCLDKRTDYQFMLRRSTVVSAVFDNELDNYRPAPLDTSYMVEHIDEPSHCASLFDTADLAQSLSQRTRHRLAALLRQSTAFATYASYNDQVLILAFCPVVGVDGRTLGFFYAVRYDPTLAQLQRGVVRLMVVSSVLMLLVFGTIAYLVITRAQILNQRLALEQLNRTKNRFFSIIAHDLRGPFNALLGFGELLEEAIENQLEDQSRQYVRMLNTASQTAYSLLENLLYWSRSQTGGLQPHPKAVEACSLVQQIVALNQLRAQEKQVTIRVELPTPCYVWADKDMVATILRNLLSNALKYTTEGGKISIEAQAQDAHIYFRVRDTGIGIAPERLANLFDLQHDRSTLGTHHEKGTGLGLLVVKEFVERNGGQLRVESKLDEGSCFSFGLPQFREANR